ncbi:ExeA family protein [Gilvimarinus sp. 1_MG-2023]|uniref:ExeA family protein n=1 Tax=Gilvimarinus sp. 1_MG-2023 TaxID=3062638 RepID=UPI0026E28B7B|nr:ExeA family protein [Gilvimarinus sp. 1_MG-2023]MDO6747152.1 AAA family ATPase [Gilvimarinus sp. 1_MG-2023]
MYHQYFGLKEPAFSIAVNPRYLYMSEQHREALAHLLYGVQGGGFVLLTGEVGTGKTTIIRSLLEQLPEGTDLAMVFNPMAEVPEMLQMICDELGAKYPPESPSIKTLTDTLHRYLLDNHSRGRRTVLLIDEAQLLSPEALEQIRLLTNLETNTQKLLQIILVGQPELNRLLAQPRLRQLSQRITARFHLNPLTLAETRAYISHRLQVAGLTGARNPFPETIVRKIFSYSGGIPRRINILCERALVGLYGHNKDRVDRKILQLAKREVNGVPGASAAALNRRSARHWWPQALLLLLGVAAMTGWWFISEAGRGEQGAAADTVVDASPEASPVVPAEQVLPPVATQSPSVPDYSIRYLSDAQAQLAAHSGLSGSLICLNGSAQAVACEVEQVDTWQALVALNRPVLLTLTTEDKFRAYGVLTAIDKENAELLDASGKPHSVALAELGARWNGQVLYLWHKPPGYNSGAAVGVGDRGPLVRWLAQAFAQLDGQAKPLAELKFTQALADRLKIFQRKHGLTVDGILGQKTILRLNERLGIDTPLQVEGDW